MNRDPSFEQSITQSIARPYRGTIWENASRFKLIGKAYDALNRNYPEQRGHFKIETANHLRGPLTALQDPNVRKVFVIGATQVLKSVIGDIWIPFIIEHIQRNILVLFETDAKGLLYCDTRFMETIKQHPVISKWLATVDRHNVNKTEITMPAMKLLVGGLNESNVSSLSWPMIWISESYQAQSNGLLRKAIQRADRFPKDCKILIESRAGLAGEDLHTESKGAHQVPLTWACPHCGGRQEWKFHNERPADFKPHEKAKIDLAPGSYAGMWFAPEEKEENGRIRHLSIDERARTAKWECYHCGEKIQDTPEIRRKIMDSYEQDYKITLENGEKVSPKEVCFILPKECALDNSFEDSAKAYLTAKYAHGNGNKIPLQDWYMAERATFYDESLTQEKVRVSVGSYDPQEIMPDEHSREMGVDCQKHLEKDTVGTFWYVVRVFDKRGNSRQLARGFARSWEEWIAVQKFWKVPNARVVIDASKWGPQIMQKAASECETIEATFLGKPSRYLSSWRLLYGDDARGFIHKDGQTRGWSPPALRPMVVYGSDGRKSVVNLQTFRWSNLTFELQLDSILAQTPGMPKWEVLSHGSLPPETQAKETGILTFDQQISARYLTEIRGKQKFEDLANREAHYRDCELMILVRVAMENLLGHIGTEK